MADYIDVAIAAIPVAKAKNLDPEDRQVKGVYSVMVQKGLSPNTMASAALDVFHSKNGIAVLDDFVFYVFDPRTGLVLEEDVNSESDSNTNLGRDCEHISNTLPGIFSVTVQAVGDDKSASDLGTTVIAADKKGAAQRKAHDILWDPRLSAASCLARYHTERLH